MIQNCVFQSTPLREGRLMTTEFFVGMPMFQSTPLREGRRCESLCPAPRQLRFNPRPCVRGDLQRPALPDVQLEFQSTPLREGRQVLQLLPNYLFLFQSTPLREGRQISLRAPNATQWVSIHAPA